jgi:hypothetical protein
VASAVCVAPSVSLSASATTVDSNNPNVTLTATLSGSLCGGNVLAIYNELGDIVNARWWYDLGGATQWPVNTSPPEYQTRTYTAYVATTLPSPGPPAGNSSNSVTVQHLGWPGTVTLTANKAQVDSSSPTATLTATLSRPLASSYILSIYDELGDKVISKYWYEMVGQTQLVQNVSPPEYQLKTYTAYVAKNASSPGPPTLEVRATSEEVTVENLGWQGSITLSSNRTQVDAGNPTATLTATASLPLPAGYLLSIYDDLGNKLLSKYWYEVPYTTRQVLLNVNPPLSQTRTYSAYVARDAPSPGPPRDTVRATSSLSFASGLLTSETMEGVDLTWLSSLATDEEFALLLSAAPMATHVQGSSLSDQTLAFNAARAAGLPYPKPLIDAALAGGVGGALLWWLADELDGMEAAPPAAPAVPLPIPEPPVITAPQPRSGTPTYQDELVRIYLQRAVARGKQMSLVAAQAAAVTCLTLTAVSISHGALPEFIDGKHPCEALPISLPGSSAPQTTHADRVAITTRNKAWIKLTWKSKVDRLADFAAENLPRDWYRAEQICTTIPDQQACHEYPYFTSGQSGPASLAGPPGAYLEVLGASDNSSGGSFYRHGFAGPCLLDGQPDTGQANGEAFLVIPLDFPRAPPSFPICLP